MVAIRGSTNLRPTTIQVIDPLMSLIQVFVAASSKEEAPFCLFEKLATFHIIVIYVIHWK